MGIACPKLDANKEIYVDKLVSLIDDAKINPDTEFTPVWQENLLEGITVLESKNLKAIPYYAWSHRGIGEMTVWLPRRAKKLEIKAD